MKPIIVYQVTKAYQEPYRESFPDRFFTEDKLEKAVRCMQECLNEGTDEIIVSLGKATYNTRERMEEEWLDGFEWLLSVEKP